MIIIIYALQIFSFLLLARSLITWFPNVNRSNPIVNLLFQVTEPVLKPVRQVLPQSGGVDWSPLVVFLIITVLLRVLFG